MNQQITLATIIDAHERIKPYIHRTQVLTNQTIDDLVGASLFFKCENSKR
jgi:threonine dehydratase